MGEVVRRESTRRSELGTDGVSDREEAALAVAIEGDAEEIGCLYYSPSRRAFVDPGEVADALPHFGRPGGVVPRVLER